MRKTALIGCLALLAQVAGADTLELRNGELLQGQYLGGTQGTVRFQVQSEMRTIPVGEILALTFDLRADAAVGAAPTAAVATEAAAAGVEASAPITVPAGAPLLIRMKEGVDSSRQRAGHIFTAVLEVPLEVNGRVVAPAGSLAYGRLVSSAQSGRLVGQSSLSLELTDVIVNGTRQPIRTGDYEAQSDKQGRDTVGKVARGAVIGGLIDGSDGAKTGAAVGAGVSLITRGESVSVPAGTLLEFRLLQPFTVGSQGAAAAQPAAAAAEQPVAPAPAPRAASGTQVPAGTPLLVRMRETIDSKRHSSGHRFTAVLEAPLEVRGAIVAPAGATVYGQLTAVKTGRRLFGKTEMKLELTDLVIDGLRQPISSSECRAVSEEEGRDTLGKVARGAVIGGLIDGSDGAKTGAAVGVGLAILTGGSDIHIQAGTLLEFPLRSGFTVR